MGSSLRGRIALSWEEGNPLNNNKMIVPRKMQVAWLPLQSSMVRRRRLLIASRIKKSGWLQQMCPVLKAPGPTSLPCWAWYCRGLAPCLLRASATRDTSTSARSSLACFKCWQPCTSSDGFGLSGGAWRSCTKVWIHSQKRNSFYGCAKQEVTECSHRWITIDWYAKQLLSRMLSSFSH